MAAKNRPIWVEVAEAGFGDRLVQLGWKRVSPAHWRLDGDGVIWRTLLGPAAKYDLEAMLEEKYGPDWWERGKPAELAPGCFADESGFEIVGLEGLIKRIPPVGKGTRLNPMIRRSVRAHLTLTIVGEAYDRSWEEILRWREENPPRKAALWERILLLRGRHIRSGEEPPLARLPDFEPAHRSWNNCNSGLWDTEELGVAEVSARLARHWETFMKPTVAARMTVRDILSYGLFTNEDPDRTGGDLADICAHYLAGDLDYCRRRLRAELNRDVRTAEEELAWMRKNDFFKGPSRNDEKQQKETARKSVERERDNIYLAEELARILDLDFE